MSFLDTTIKLDGDSYESTVYRKPTFTSLILNFRSVAPLQWKLGLIYCLLNRAYAICSSWILFHTEVETLQKMFKVNGYPIDLFERCVNNFLNKKLAPANATLFKELPTCVLSIPFIGKPSIIFKKKLESVFKKYLNSKLTCVFTSYKVKNYFSLKTKTPIDLQSRCVYRFKCSSDATITYLGKTKRHLATRIKEHKYSKSDSAIFFHLVECENCSLQYSSQLFQIIASGKNDFEISIKEALLIKKLKPSLNGQIFQNGSLSHLLQVF